MVAARVFFTVSVLSLVVIFSLTPKAFATQDSVRIFGIGQAFVGPPGSPFDIQYEVSSGADVNHYFYINDVLRLTRRSSEISQNALGHFSLRYPGGLADNSTLGLRICVDASPQPVCDEVSIRGGTVLPLNQALEIAPVGVNQYVATGQLFPIKYTILQPTNDTTRLYVDDSLRASRSSTAGPTDH